MKPLPSVKFIDISSKRRYNFIQRLTTRVPLRKQTMNTTPRRVLLVDDEEAILFAFAQLLKAQDVQIDIASNMQDAITLLEKNDYLAVVADLRLSGSSDLEGYQVVRKARESNPASIIIVVTAYGGEETQQKVMDLGADYYFEKPVSPNAIKELLQSKAVYS